MPVKALLNLAGFSLGLFRLFRRRGMPPGCLLAVCLDFFCLDFREQFFFLHWARGSFLGLGCWLMVSKEFVLLGIVSTRQLLESGLQVFEPYVVSKVLFSFFFWEGGKGSRGG